MMVQMRQLPATATTAVMEESKSNEVVVPKSKYPRESAGLQSASDGVRDARESSRFMFNTDYCQCATRGRTFLFR